MSHQATTRFIPHRTWLIPHPFLLICVLSASVLSPFLARINPAARRWEGPKQPKLSLKLARTSKVKPQTSKVKLG